MSADFHEYHCRFVFCRQRSDERLKRGGEQKSVVVLSTQPYSGVLTPLSQHAGPLYFNNGRAALQEVSIFLQHRGHIGRYAFSSDHCFASPHASANEQHTGMVMLFFGIPAHAHVHTSAHPSSASIGVQLSSNGILLAQVYQEVQAWEPPSPGLRGIVMVGAVTLPAQVPAPATLPAAPPSSSANPEDLEHPLAPLPVVRQANGCDTIQGTFFEVGWSPLHLAASWFSAKCRCGECSCEMMMSVWCAGRCLVYTARSGGARMGAMGAYDISAAVARSGPFTRWAPSKWLYLCDPSSSASYQCLRIGVR